MQGERQEYSREEPYSSGRRKGVTELWKHHRQDGRPEQIDGNRKTHTDLWYKSTIKIQACKGDCPTAMENWKCFGRVRERHGPFARRVEGGKEIYEQRDHPQMRRAVFRDVEAKASRQECPGHMRERE